MYMKKIIGHSIQAVIVEVFIIFCLIFLINNYFKNVDTTINSDGVGYYDYLPSMFIHHDFARKDIPLQNNSGIYNRINTIGAYVNYKAFKVDKYPCGTAVLQLPFFLTTLTTTNLEGNFTDGYQRPFQIGIFHATIFYLFLSLFFLKRTLELFNTKKYIIILTQLFFVFATSVTHYANYDAGFSHIYSLFAITAFIYFVKLFFTRKNINHFVIACLFLGLILILRQINVIILLFVPFLAGSLENLKDGISKLFGNRIKLFLGISLVLGIFFIQCFLWYLQTGHFLIYSYQGEGFNFRDPHIINILFSYRKGLFVYTPVLFLCLLSILFLAYKRNYYLAFTWIAFFSILTYILSSWWTWFYNDSYGLRVYIDFYTVFFIPFAIMLNEAPVIMKLVFIVLSFLTVPVNIIQTYQYDNFILHWSQMNKDKYWKVFLKTDVRYQGLLWTKKYDFRNYRTLKEIPLGNIMVNKNKFEVFYRLNSSEISGFQNVCIIQVSLDNDYGKNNDSEIILVIEESNTKHNYYWNKIPLLHFPEGEFNKFQTGVGNFEFLPITDQKEKQIEFAVNSGKYNGILRNVRLKFLGQKENK